MTVRSRESPLKGKTSNPDMVCKQPETTWNVSLNKSCDVPLQPKINWCVSLPRLCCNVSLTSARGAGRWIVTFTSSESDLFTFGIKSCVCLGNGMRFYYEYVALIQRKLQARNDRKTITHAFSRTNMDVKILLQENHLSRSEAGNVWEWWSSGSKNIPM